MTKQNENRCTPSIVLPVLEILLIMGGGLFFVGFTLRATSILSTPAHMQYIGNSDGGIINISVDLNNPNYFDITQPLFNDCALTSYGEILPNGNYSKISKTYAMEQFNITHEDVCGSFTNGTINT